MSSNVRWRRAVAAAVFSALSATSVYAQAGGVGVIEGTVKDAQTGQPLEGVQVAVYDQLGPSRLVALGIGAMTNRDGGYRIANAPARGLMVRARFIGFGAVDKQVTVRAGGSVTVDFQLQQSALQLGAVVTTGTAVATEVKHLGNTVAQIEAPKFAPIATTNELLQGREPGVVGLPSSGMTGTGARIRIRGNASLSQSNEPVIFVDGIRINSSGDFSANIGDGGAAAPSRLDDIDPSTIERVEILKGAAAATLYGTEASNGVIQIFTKKGSAGKPKWDFQLQGDLLRYPDDRLDSNWGVPKTAADASALNAFFGRTDIQAYKKFDEPFVKRFYDVGKSTTGSLSITGGTEGITYFVNGRYYKENGPFGGTQYGPAIDEVRRANATINLGFVPYNNLRIGVRSAYTNTSQETPQNANNIYAPVTQALFGKPELSACNDGAVGNVGDGTCKGAGNTFGVQGFGSPEELMYIRTQQKIDRVVSSIDVTYTPWQDLSWSTTGGVDYTGGQNFSWQPFGTDFNGIYNNDPAGNRTVQDRNQREMTLDSKLNWSRDLFGMNSSFVVGVQGFFSRSAQPGAFNHNFPGPGINVVSAGDDPVALEVIRETVNGGGFVQEQLGLTNWIYLTGGARYDFSSTFGKSSSGVLYPKASISVVPSDREGWKPMLGISSVRLRGAWGQSGRQPGAFDKLTTFNPLSGDAGSGLSPGNIGNPDLKPEVSTEIEGGAEVGIWGDKLGLQYTYWNRKVKDLLVDKQYPISGGFQNTQLSNIGEMEASGQEIGIKAFLIQRANLSADVFVNGAYLKQTVTSLGGAAEIKVGGSYPRYRNYIKEGYTPGAMFNSKLARPCSERPAGKTYQCLNPGELAYDFNGDGKADTEAQILAVLAGPVGLPKLIAGNVIYRVDEDGDGDPLDHYGGKPFPDWTGSFGGSLNIGRNWKLYSLFEYKAGDYQYSCLTCAFRNSNARGENTLASAKVEEVMINPASTAQQRLAAAKDWLDIVALNGYPGLNQQSPGDWVRWRELSITYTASRSLAERLGARDLSLSLTGRNLTLWAPKYIGQDPEINIYSAGVGAGLQNNFNEGIDGFGMPIPRRVALSIRLGY
ncbi:MAG: Vitamin B12 transporter BtuB [Gemmatimonadaceae bacterium]|nr:Vitamin B12 transporter BtuB [Gemmatimonadaceae bacterium]